MANEHDEFNWSSANILGTLPKQGNSNFESQTAAITKIIRLFKDYKVVLFRTENFVQSN